MGLRPFNDAVRWQPIGAHMMDGLRATGSFFSHAVAYAPLVTATIATIAGGIACYSIHVTRTIARRTASPLAI
jgi:hypothetical protein